MSSKKNKAIDAPKQGINECYCSYVERITLPHQLHCLNQPGIYEDRKYSENSPFSKESSSYSSANNMPLSCFDAKKSPTYQVSSLKSQKLKFIYSSAMQEIGAHEKWVSDIIHFRNTNRINHLWK